VRFFDRRHQESLAALCAVVASLVSCSSSSAASANGSDGGSSTGAGQAAAVHELASPQCHDVVNVGDTVVAPEKGPYTQDQLSSMIPVSTGGSIADGVYTLKSETIAWQNTDSGQIQTKEMIVVAGTKWYRVRDGQGGGWRQTMLVELGASRLKWSYACTSSEDYSSGTEWGYSATGDGFQLVIFDGWLTILNYVRK
jgi:hypothetical protein